MNYPPGAHGVNKEEPPDRLSRFPAKCAIDLFHLTLSVPLALTDKYEWNEDPDSLNVTVMLLKSR